MSSTPITAPVLTLSRYIEDVTMLGYIFSHRSHPAQISPMLRAYQGLLRAAETQRVKPEGG